MFLKKKGNIFILNGANMDISGMINSLIPTLSYAVNLFERIFTIFAAYLGVDINKLYADSKEQENA